MKSIKKTKIFKIINRFRSWNSRLKIYRNNRKKMLIQFIFSNNNNINNSRILDILTITIIINTLIRIIIIYKTVKTVNNTQNIIGIRVI